MEGMLVLQQRRVGTQVSKESEVAVGAFVTWYKFELEVLQFRVRGEIGL